MELTTGKHTSATSSYFWIIFIVVIQAVCIQNGYCLQGMPTWICLGIKSPFIEFKATEEVLSNVSVSLNTSSTEKGLNKNGIPGGSAPFDYPIDLRNETATSTEIPVIKIRKEDFQRSKHRDFMKHSSATTENPVIADMNSKKEVTIIEIHNDEDYSDDKVDSERKYIIPLALKNPTAEPRKSQLFQDSSTNIDDLKRHILMLQNLTKNDQSFQSKFVVFPSLQRNDSVRQALPSAPPSPPQPPRSLPPTKSSIPIPRINTARQSLRYPAPSFSGDNSNALEKITIIPQVFLQNDQMPMNDDSFEMHTDDHRSKEASRTNYTRRKDYRNKLMGDEVIVKKTTTTTSRPRNMQRRRKSGARRNRNSTRRPPLTQCRGSDCMLNRTLAANRDNSMVVPINVTVASADGKDRHKNHTTPTNESNYNFNLSQNHFENYPHANANNASGTVGNAKLSRSARSHHHHHQQRNSTKDLLFPSTLNTNQTQINYKENIDLNPDLCYGVGGLSYGQQKICVLHTHIMPAISRGARSAIQECRHQFKNRRWNCSTVDDDSVFGPLSGIGSPEMAFVHALAAAGAASFVARACRDGQLTSCGCSRSARPNHLHDDWTWGGCGDDLEYGYKFSQNFIDIREKEKKRGARGLISVPQKFDKFLTGSDTFNDTHESEPTQKEDTSGPIKAEDLLELQEKITKEILSSKLQENDMHELQAKINKELLNSKVFNLEHQQQNGRKAHRNGGGGSSLNRLKTGTSAKARSMMNLHNNEAGRRAVIKKSKITCKCHGVSGSCSLITCWQQLTSMREIGDYLREKYDEATQVKINKRGRLQVKDNRYKVPTALDLVYLDESPDFCRINRQLHWSGTHNRVCNKTSSGLDGCAILCCGRGYNTKKIVVKERCNCKFHWCCHVKCDTCVKVIEEYSCK